MGSQILPSHAPSAPFSVITRTYTSTALEVTVQDVILCLKSEGLEQDWNFEALSKEAEKQASALLVRLQAWFWTLQFYDSLSSESYLSWPKLSTLPQTVHEAPYTLNFCQHLTILSLLTLLV